MNHRSQAQLDRSRIIRKRVLEVAAAIAYAKGKRALSWKLERMAKR